jgi:hypothetical protein
LLLLLLLLPASMVPNLRRVVSSVPAVPSMFYGTQ